eukprot:3333254-Pyramimonas_sp.AAC.1
MLLSWSPGFGVGLRAWPCLPWDDIPGYWRCLPERASSLDLWIFLISDGRGVPGRMIQATRLVYDS